MLLLYYDACHSAISHPHRRPQISDWQNLCRRLRYINILGSSWGKRFCTCRLLRCAVTRLCHASAARVGFSIRKRRAAERRSTAFPSLPSSAGSAAAVLENSCINTLSHAYASWLMSAASPAQRRQMHFLWDSVSCRKHSGGCASQCTNGQRVIREG